MRRFLSLALLGLAFSWPALARGEVFLLTNGGRVEGTLLNREESPRKTYIVQTPLGGRVICEERDLLYKEAPMAYKNIEAVIGELVEAGLISVLATLRPVLTYKVRKLRR